MTILIDFLNFILLGAIISLTVRWVLLQYRSYQLRSAQKEPFDRMIHISSKEILKGVIRKRAFKAGPIAQTGIEKTNQIDKQTENVLNAAFESFAEQNLKLSLIPNEDIDEAIKRDILDDSSKYFLNDQIIVRLSDREKKEIAKQNAEKMRLEQEAQELRERQHAEQQKRLKEKEVEDQINI